MLCDLNHMKRRRAIVASSLWFAIAAIVMRTESSAIEL
jgi:hypothetical protein